MSITANCLPPLYRRDQSGLSCTLQSREGAGVDIASPGHENATEIRQRGDDCTCRWRFDEGRASTVKCPICDGLIGLNNRACPKCGNLLVATPTASTPANPLGAQCPHCGASHQPASGACTHCGKDLQQRAPQPPPGLGSATPVDANPAAGSGRSPGQGFHGAGAVPSGGGRISERAAPGFRWNCHECGKDNNKDMRECVFCGHRYCSSCKVYMD